MDRASVWRSKEIAHAVTLGSSTSKELYLAAELRGHRGLVRDIAWAPGNVRGFDVVATACKDGFVRVFQISTPASGGQVLRSKDYARVPEQAIPLPVQRAVENGAAGLRNSPSGIGAGLAGARSSVSGSSRQQDADEGHPGQVMHVAQEVSKLENRSPVWRVDFDDDGQLLGSTGDDGKLNLWRREPSGVWSRSAELALRKTVVV
jgi:nucleoporin SEH1